MMTNEICRNYAGVVIYLSEQKLIIKGGKPLKGTVKVQGAKNSVLPIIAASLMCEGETVLHNCPCISDTYASCRILSYLGCRCSFKKDEKVLSIDPSGADKTFIPDELMQEMRSSIIYMGAMLGAFGECKLSFPGGCQLGPRPIDMHLSALRKMGVTVKEQYGGIECRINKRIHGAKIILGYPSVGATENIILAAVKAQGETVISNAAREPEIADLTAFLNKCGAKIKGAGCSKIIIEGVEKLYGCTYSIMPDRIAAATYISSAVCSGGEIELRGIDIPLCESFMSVFEQMGCGIYPIDGGIYVNAGKRLKAPSKIITLPHPGFPTDAQPPLMAAVCKAKGTTIFEETVFEDRYRHVDALVKMGADIKVIGKAAVINGADTLYGAKVQALDLRGGAALTAAAMGAEGITEISGVCYIDRGYDNIEKVLSELGGDIKRV